MDVFAIFVVVGAPETLALNMSKLVLSVLTSVKTRDPLASEVSIPFLLDQLSFLKVNRNVINLVLKQF